MLGLFHSFISKTSMAFSTSQGWVWQPAVLHILSRSQFLSAVQRHFWVLSTAMALKDFIFKPKGKGLIQPGVISRNILPPSSASQKPDLRLDSNSPSHHSSSHRGSKRLPDGILHGDKHHQGLAESCFPPSHGSKDQEWLGVEVCLKLQGFSKLPEAGVGGL